MRNTYLRHDPRRGPPKPGVKRDSEALGLKFRHEGVGFTSQRTRDRLIQRLRQRGINSDRVLEAMAKVPRHLFMDEALATRAYEDDALPIGFGQTISQPWVVARMTEALLGDQSPRKVLEVGTGSGYQAAVLSRLVEQVYSVERIRDLLRLAQGRFRELGYHNIQARHSDGSVGLNEQAPFDGIIVTAGAREVPVELMDQLAVGGRMVIPVGDDRVQDLQLIIRGVSGFERLTLDKVLFVPLLPGER